MENSEQINVIQKALKKKVFSFTSRSSRLLEVLENHSGSLSEKELIALLQFCRKLFFKRKGKEKIRSYFLLCYHQMLGYPNVLKFIERYWFLSDILVDVLGKTAELKEQKVILDYARIAITFHQKVGFAEEILTLLRGSESRKYLAVKEAILS